MASMGTQKPLIVPWLVEQLDAQRYPGVSWLNVERTLFRVPWKHGSRQGVSSEDFQIFEDWAIARGRYRPGIDQRTPSDWKRNFRAALNRKEGIKMIQDNSTDADDPHKVFEIQSDPILNGFAQGEVNSVVSDVSAIPLGSTNVCGDSSSFSQDDALESVLSALDLSSHIEEHPVLEHPISCGDLPSSHMDLLLPAAPLSPLEQICGSNTFESDFDVRVYYRGRQVLADVFKNARGLCFLPPGCSSSHYPDLADVVLPGTDILNDKQQVNYTNRILRGMDPGVLLRIDGPLLCGMRQSSSHIYWSHSETPTDEMLHGELPKGQFGPVYYFQQFVQELIGYLEDRNGSPNYTLWFCFGEKWPDTDRSWKKKLIMVQVIPKTLETLHELSKAQGASSLKNCERDLRISDSLQKCRLQDHLKEWGEKMEMQFN